MRASTSVVSVACVLTLSGCLGGPEARLSPAQPVTPIAVEGVPPPDPGVIVARRKGPIMIYSAEEQSDLDRQRAAMLRTINQPSLTARTAPH